MRKEDRIMYMAGGCLNRGEVMLREYEAKLVREAGLDKNLYNPIENKEINDKKTANNDGLAERIYKQDTEAILKCNTFVAEAMEKNLGTCMEIQMCVTSNMYNDLIRKIIDSGLTNSEKLEALSHMIDIEIPYKEIYTHYNDIRMPLESEQGFRRSTGYHQYLLGCVLEATGRYPYETMEEIIEVLNE